MKNLQIFSSVVIFNSHNWCIFDLIFYIELFNRNNPIFNNIRLYYENDRREIVMIFSLNLTPRNYNMHTWKIYFFMCFKSRKFIRRTVWWNWKYVCKFTQKTLARRSSFDRFNASLIICCFHISIYIFSICYIFLYFKLSLELIRLLIYILAYISYLIFLLIYVLTYIFFLSKFTIVSN